MIVAMIVILVVLIAIKVATVIVNAMQGTTVKETALHQRHARIRRHVEMLAEDVDAVVGQRAHEGLRVGEVALESLGPPAEKPGADCRRLERVGSARRRKRLAVLLVAVPVRIVGRHGGGLHCREAGDDLYQPRRVARRRAFPAHRAGETPGSWRSAPPPVDEGLRMI